MQHPDDDYPIPSQPVENGVAGVLIAEIAGPDLVDSAAETGLGRQD
jgi:hypothetical protein